MKNRWLALVLVVVLCLGLLPMQVLASGNPDEEKLHRVCRSYEQFVDALNTPGVQSIMIWPKWEIIAGSGENEYFEWPTEDVDLIIDRNNDASISIQGDWTIPENVTVYCYDPITIGGDLTVNGDWYSMNNWAIVHGSTFTITFNGDVYMNGQNSGFINTQQNVFHQNLRINAGNVSINNMVLGNGARVSGQEFEIRKSLSCPNGSATVDSKISCQNRTTVTLSGNLKMGDIRTNYANLIIAADSRVTVGKFNMYKTETMTVNGHLILPRETYQGMEDNSIIINAGGVMDMLPGSQIGGVGSTGTISGEGTLRLYGDERERDWYWNKPRIYGEGTDENTILKEQVTVRNIWRNWENPCDEHIFGEPEITPATCKDHAVEISYCTKCGLQKMEEDLNSELSNEHDWKWYSSSGTIGHRCNICSKLGTAQLSATNGIYTGQPVTNVHTVTYSELWEGGSVSISYENNINPGENTAKVIMSCKGYSTYVNFSIFEGNCAHEGGTATCYAQAVCTKCGEGYGKKKSHDFYISQSTQVVPAADGHIINCRNTGCTEQKTEAHRYYKSESDYYIDLEMGYINGGKPNYNSHSCYLCGYGKLEQELKLEEGKVTVTVSSVAAGDQIVAAMYDENGKFLGCGVKVAEQSGSMDVPVSYTGNGDHLRVFFPKASWSVDRLSSDPIPVTGK